LIVHSKIFSQELSAMSFLALPRTTRKIFVPSP
jgi:hypothetical protein